MTLKHIRRIIPIRAVALSLSDVKRIYERLAVQVSEEADRALVSVIRQPDEDDRQFNERKEQIRASAFRITVTIAGTNNEELYGDSVEIFDSPNLPDQITLIFLTNETAFEAFAKFRPPQRFSVTLDFSRPSLISSTPVSDPTPNSSQAMIEGQRDAWVASVSEAITTVLSTRKTERDFIHRAFIYDLGLALFALPAGIYLCSKLSDFVSTKLPHPFLSGTFYVYLILITFWIYRVLFGYTKWAFPTVEIEGSRDRSMSHRRVWAGVMISLAAAAMWALLSSLFGF